MHFIRSQGANLNEAVGAHQNQRIAIQNPEYINIQFSRIVLPTEEQVRANPYRYTSLQIAPPTEPCLFHFVYDKDDARNWYISLESPSLNPAIYYFPVRSATESSIPAKDVFSTLFRDMAQNVPIVSNKTLMFFLLERMFTRSMTSNLSFLKEIEKSAQETVCINLPSNDPAYKSPVYLLMDLFATQINQTETPDNNRLLILLLQIIHRTKDQPELLQTIIEQNDCYLNGMFLLDKISAHLNLTPIPSHQIPSILTPGLRNTLKNYHQQRDHTTALARYWEAKVKEEYARDLASARFFHQAYIAITITNVVGIVAAISLFIIFGGGLNFLLGGLVFAAGALLYGYQASQPYKPSIRLWLTDIEIDEANKTLAHSYPLVSDALKTTIEQVCSVFEEKTRIVTAASRVKVPAGYGTSSLTLLAPLRPDQESLDDNHLKLLFPL